MEIQQLIYFSCVAKHENISRAAVELHISQPSLSSSISRLENELGAKLFDRKNGRIYLKGYGRYILSTSQKILDLVNSTKLPHYDVMSTERLSIALQHYDDKLLSFVMKFREMNPHVEFHIHVSILNESFSLSSYDFIIGHANIPMPAGYHSFSFDHSLKYYAVIPKSDPLSQSSSLNIWTLRDKPFCFLQDSMGNLEPAYHKCIEAGFIPNCVITVDSPFFKYRCLSCGTAYSIIPSTWYVPYSKQNRQSLVPLDEPESGITSQIFWTDQIATSHAARSFLDFVQNSHVLLTEADFTFDIDPLS